MYKEVNFCRICGNKNLVQVIDLGVQALTGVFPKNKSASVTEGPLKLVKCMGDDCCGLLQLSASYDLGEMYGDNYGYRSGLNKSMVAHLHGKIKRILSKYNFAKEALIIDIGANDSTSLQAYPKGEYQLVGIDPTGKKFKQYYPEHIQLIPDFFSGAIIKKNFGNKKADIITSFSMFYDLEEPQIFMREISESLSDQGIWVFEQSYMPMMLDTNSYDTICHEHLEYYALKQIKWMTDHAGLKIIDVEFNDINGGSFSVTAAKADSSYLEYRELGKLLDDETKRGLDTLRPFQDFENQIEKSKNDILSFFEKCQNEGKKVYALGASTKGNVILQYCNITTKHLAAIGEVNPDKFGAYAPKTLIPIISEDEVLKLRPDYLMVLPWHFRQFFLNEPKFKDFKLVFPLPQFQVVNP